MPEVNTMSRHFWVSLALLSSALLMHAQPARAQQTFNVNIGYFTPHGQDARVEGDVLTADRNFLVFDVKDFNSAAFGAEWLIPLGNYVEAGAGAAFMRRTVPTVYNNFVNANGSEIAQDLKLRQIPVDFTFRVVPLGQHNGFQPFFGGGLSVINWRYSESGEFIDTSDNSIFNGSFVGKGTATGPVAMAGLRFSGSSATAGFEARYRKAQGTLSTTDFLAPKIDLGGWTYQFNVGMRFGR
jgi:hypothetical protein